MEDKLSKHYLRRFYFGTPAPLKITSNDSEFNINRKQLIKNYNSILKSKVAERGSFFVDIYSLTTNEFGENNNLHMCEDGIHLSPSSLSTLFENYLFKP